MRIRHAAILSLAAVVLGACSSGSSTIGATDTSSGNGAPPPVVRAPFRPIFQLAQGMLPYPTDLFMNGSVDGTVNFPALAVTPNGAAVNTLDGFGVNSEITVRFSMPIDATTLATPGAITVIETTMRTVIASATSVGRVPIGVRRILVPGTDYTATVSDAADARGEVLSIKPLKPLTPSTGAALEGAPAGLVDNSGVGYLVVLTSAIKATDGTAALPDNDFAGIRQAIGANPAAPSPGCAAITDPQGAAVCAATVPQLLITAATAALTHVDPTKVVRSALQHAASIGGLMLTTEAMVAEHVEEPAA